MNDIDRIEAQRRDDAEARLWLAMAPLRSVVSFMNTGAHPDDETTSMLAALALRDGLRVSVACSTRGEGGQNALGPETSRDLGVIRTREMERAAELLGMPVYWLSDGPDDPIFDFGFSKSGEETLAKWGKERLIARFVRALRLERPDIVCPTFLDVPGQHGHHRAMTQAAFEAVTRAADPAHEDGLPPWQVAKLYLPAWSGAGDSYDDDEPPPPATVNVDASGADPVLGADYAQIAEWSRAFHRTQSMGRWVEPGGRHSKPLHLAWAAGNRGPEEELTDGLPRNLADLGLDAAQREVDAIFAAWPDRDAIAEHAVQALAALQDVEGHAHRIAAKRRQLSRVVALARGFDASLSVTPSLLRPGGRATVKVTCREVPGLKANVALPGGWRLEGDQVQVPADAEADNPMPDEWQPDRGNSALKLSLNWQEDGQTLEVEIDPEERPFVLPDPVAALSPDAAVLNLARPAPIETRFEAEGSGRPEFACPDGWRVDVSGAVARFEPVGATPPGIADFPLRLDGRPAHTVSRMAYPHTGPLARPAPAKFRISSFHADWPDARIGYVPGGSDRVDEWLRSAGLKVATLAGGAMESADLAGFDTLLVGIFAARSNPGFARRIAEVRDWVRDGGTLVTLYHRPWDNWEVVSLAPLEIGKPSLRWRVTDENAEVTVLEPGHPVFNGPNRIGPEDWAGWRKERGLYFAARWEAPYHPLLAMADPGEAPHRGALLEGRFGAGCHRHCALILHHQLDELVGGAYRLMGNLLRPLP